MIRIIVIVPPFVAMVQLYNSLLELSTQKEGKDVILVCADIVRFINGLILE